MITRQTRLQLVVFLVLSLVGISYTGLRYAGLDRYVTERLTVAADFADSGGIFEGAEVTYRGVPVGTVDRLELVPGGVRVHLALEEGTRVPRDTRAAVANRSAVGEQYVDLRPQSDGAPYLRSGDVVAQDRTEIPVQAAQLLRNLDRFVTSVDTDDLGVVLEELGTAFDGAGPDLQRLVDEGNALTAAATEALPETRQLIRDGVTVLETQRQTSDELRSFSRDLALLSGTLRSSDADLRRLFRTGTASAQALERLLDANRSALPVLLSNLVTTAQVQQVRLPALRQILVTYPNVLGGGYTVTPGDGTAHFGFVFSGGGGTPAGTGAPPPPCTRGYETTRKRPASDVRDVPANTRAYCAEDSASGTNVRGAQNAPRPLGIEPFPRDEERSDRRVRPGTTSTSSRTSASSVVLAGYDPVTGQLVAPDGTRMSVRSTAGARAVLGEDSWRWLLLGPLTR